jgi:hypothetical protein
MPLWALKTDHPSKRKPHDQQSLTLPLRVGLHLIPDFDELGNPNIQCKVVGG